MAAAFGAVLGSNAAFVQAGTTQTITVTTSASVPANGRIVVASYLWDGGASHTARVSGISDGSAYTQDGLFTDGDDIVDLWSRQPAGGLPSGTVITATTNSEGIFVSSGAWFLSVFYLTGTDSAAGYAEATTSQNNTGTTWSTGSVSNITADAIYVGAVGYEDPTAGTNNASMSSGTEIHDLYNGSSQQGMATGYLVASSVASRAVSGSLSNANSTLNAGLVVVYRGTTAAASSPSPRTFNAIPFIGGGL